jgi:uncharacterized zinc-type alcohol dehydrogenase-like protein
MARNEWGFSTYPLVPGHEIIGRVAKVGSAVTKFREGDLVGVGCMVDSCRTCSACRDGVEQFCEQGMTQTYASPDKHTGGFTYGGYSKAITVYEGFVLKVSEKLDPAAAAPLLCAGITTWSPLRRWRVGPGKKVGIVGLGGLGHMGVKLAKALGAEVVMFTTSPSKVADAQKLGAHEAVISTDKEAMARHKRSFDLIINTVSAPHDLDLYMALLKRDGAQVLVGLPSTPHDPIKVGRMIGNRLTLAASTIGGIRETQEMLDFCAEHGIVSDIETIDIQSINDAYERMLKGDVKYRFVIDMASLKNGAKAA